MHKTHCFGTLKVQIRKNILHIETASCVRIVGKWSNPLIFVFLFPNVYEQGALALIEKYVGIRYNIFVYKCPLKNIIENIHL